MILNTTPTETVYKVMAEEKQKVMFALAKAEPKARRQFTHLRKASDFPSVWCDTYSVPASRNTYLLWYYAEAEGESSYRSWGGSALLLNAPDGKRIAYALKEYSTVDVTGMRMQERHSVLLMYTGHFFGRYRERRALPHPFSPLQVMGHFFGVNSDFAAKLHEDKVIRFPDKYRDCSAYQLRNGLALGSETVFAAEGKAVLFVTYKTFVPFSMLKDQQREHVSDERLMDAYVGIVEKLNDPRGPFAPALSKYRK